MKRFVILLYIFEWVKYTFLITNLLLVNLIGVEALISDIIWRNLEQDMNKVPNRLVSKVFIMDLYT